VQTLNTVLIVGLGDIGENILEQLARAPAVSKIYAADRNEEEFISKVYSAISGAIHQGYSPRVEFCKLDLNDIDATAEQLTRIKPDVIVSAVALKTWWAPQAALGADLFMKLDEVGFGPWLPLQLTLVTKLMRAVKQAEIGTHVVNCSFPDAVNAILNKIGLAPTVGMGNCDLFLPWLRKIVAERAGVPVKKVLTYFVGHHFLCHALASYRSTCGCPSYLKIMVGDKDITDQFDVNKLLIESNAYMPKGAKDHFIVAASAVKNTLGILLDTNELTYAPGAEGLPGGYPTRLSRDGAKVQLPDGISLREAVKINEDSQRLDGIERIESDGTTVFTDKAYNVMKDLLDYKCKSVKPEESEQRARELLQVLDRLKTS
jgi:hypothetical protein